MNTFVAGYITEASPLTFPQNASLDEQNFILNNNGYRSRRPGMDLETGHVTKTTSASLITAPYINSFKWKNAGGIASKTLIVVQVGTEITIFDNGIMPLSAGQIYDLDYGSLYSGKIFSFASVDGFLIVTTGGKTIDVYTYDGTSISRSTKRLLVRDLFGVADVVGGVDYRNGSNVTTRPTTLTPAHTYNLRNQTWAIPHPDFDPDDPVIIDSISNFTKNANNVNGSITYPSNSDYVTPFIYAETDSKADKIVPRFDGKSCVSNPLGNTASPLGYFIIDALDRGTSRIAANQLLQAQYPQDTNYSLAGLPLDSTPTGATCLAEFAGRVFYSGFTGSIVGGDASSPRMSSYILFSQLVQDISDINLCYQAGDPTSKDNSDLLDTDGGFIRIQGAYNISSMVTLGDALMVFAENGVWAITGGNSYGFTATNYKVAQITSSGCISPGSVVVVENALMYWSRDGIYNLSQNQFGDYSSISTTRKTIQSYYNNIGQVEASRAQGVYDSYEHKVKWMFNDDTGTIITELVYDIILQGFYKLIIKSLATNYPRVAKGLQTDPFLSNQLDVAVDDGPDQVYVSNGDIVVVDSLIQANSVKEVQYLIILSDSPVTYTFGTYSNPDHIDWESLDGVGIDAPAYLLTGVLAGGDYQRKKGIASMTVHMTKTETGFMDDGTGSGDITPKDASSCLVQAQWDFTNLVTSGRWTTPYQAYRHRRPYIPTDISDTYNDGYYIVESKNRIRGNGTVLSFLFTTEPNKHCEILGWSCTIGVSGNV